jgi:hypothetical protein
MVPDRASAVRTVFLLFILISSLFRSLLYGSQPLRSIRPKVAMDVPVDPSHPYITALAEEGQSSQILDMTGCRRLTIGTIKSNIWIPNAAKTWDI